MLQRLRSRISTLYTGLFLAVFAPAFLLVYLVIQEEVRATVRDELAASGDVFDRLVAARADQLRESADVLSRDFGFREAFATGDRSTIASALDNLNGRLGVTRALAVDADGRVIADASGAADEALFPYRDLLRDAEDAGASARIAVLDGEPYQLVASPVFAPTLVGWTVFAEALGDDLAGELGDLAPIALETRFETVGMASATRSISDARPLTLIDDRSALTESDGAQGRELVLIKSLDVAASSPPVTLVLNYPLRASFARYRGLVTAIALLGAAGVGALMAGSWFLSIGITRPIRALADAASRLQDGEYVQVEARGGGREVRELADGFNAMVDGINHRERRITHLALTDPDTGLANRAALQRRLATRVAGKDGKEGAGALFLAAFGVDRFATIRTAIGHAQSSALIREVARTLEALRPGDPVARLSSSALGLAFRARDHDEAADIVEGVQAAFERAPITVGATAVDIRLTAGMAGLPGDAPDEQTLIERAQIALDQARVRNVHAALFDPAAERATAGNLTLLSELRRGLENGEIQLAHQPKLDLRKGEVTGTECLLRWTHPEFGPVAPDNFIPLAEETGLIGAITAWVLARALDDQRAYAEAGHDISVAVNISARSLADSGFVEDVAAVLRAHAAPADRLTLEITETAVMDRPDVAFETLERLKALGVKLSIDDYGTGLSSLAYLKRLPVQELKIDKSFVLNLSKDKNDAVLVRSTIDLAHSLGLKVVAEGVEDQASLELLALFACDQAQGYHIGRPMPASDVRAMLEAPPHALVQASRSDPKPDRRKARRA
jgi:diguanylate cyclase (GGDEF)-like protein